MDHRFAFPVIISPYTTVSTVQEAAAVLLRWPPERRHQKRYLRAVSAVALALASRREAEAEGARQCFAEAVAALSRRK